MIYNISQYIDAQRVNAGDIVFVDGMEFVVVGYYRQLNDGKVLKMKTVSDGQEYCLDGKILFKKINCNEFCPYSKAPIEITRFVSSSAFVRGIGKNDYVFLTEYQDYDTDSNPILWRIETTGIYSNYYKGRNADDITAFRSAVPEIQQPSVQCSDFAPISEMSFHSGDFLYVDGKYLAVNNIEIEVDEKYQVNQIVSLEELVYTGFPICPKHHFNYYKLDINKNSFTFIGDNKLQKNSSEIYVLKNFRRKRTIFNNFYRCVSKLIPIPSLKMKMRSWIIRTFPE